jgi:catechol 2,3-dioxygenase-like lactoylglutathione lyase family enzyme
MTRGQRAELRMRELTARAELSKGAKGYSSTRHIAGTPRPRTRSCSADVVVMIHHVSVGTNDLGRARPFYDAVLAVLGLRLIRVNHRALLYGTGDIIFSVEVPSDGRPASAGNGTHVAFAAGARGVVDKFYAAGLANGGSDAGAPGLRDYDPHYYAAFLHDPDGNKIEAVTFSGK